MSDPRFESGEWFSAILTGLVTGVIAGMGAFAAFFRASKSRIYEHFVSMETQFKEKMRQVETDMMEMNMRLEKAMNELSHRHNAQHAQLIKLEANQVNATERLNELKNIQKEGIDKLERTVENSRREINDQLRKLMEELRTKT